jgi:hypothetical protein
VLITVSTLDDRRRTPEKITELARMQVTHQALITNDPEVLNNAFFMVLAFVTFDPAAVPHIGALVGYHANSIPGMGMNGYPIFTGMDFVHIDDLPSLHAEILRMQTALGITTEGDGQHAP